MDAFVIDKSKPSITRKNGSSYTAQRNLPSQKDLAVVNDMYPRSFISVTSLPARDISVGADGTVYMISKDYYNNSSSNPYGYSIYRWLGGSLGWTKEQNMGAIGNPWVITSDKQIYRQIPGHRSLTKVTGWGYEITSDSQNGIYMLSGNGTNHALYKWTGSRWLKQPGNGVKLSAGQANNLWVVKADGSMYRRD